MSTAEQPQIPGVDTTHMPAVPAQAGDLNVGDAVIAKWQGKDTPGEISEVIRFPDSDDAIYGVRLVCWSQDNYFGAESLTVVDMPVVEAGQKWTYGEDKDTYTVVRAESRITAVLRNDRTGKAVGTVILAQRWRLLEPAP